MLAQAAASGSFFELLQSIDRDALSAVFILSTIGFFGSVIVGILAISTSISRISCQKMTQSTIRELMSQGYAADDIERLVYGPTQKIQKTNSSRPAMPPIKQRVPARV